MSEPVIKAVGMHCPKCRTNTDEHRRTVLGGDPWMHCSFCDVDTVAIYGPDALVRVAESTAAAAGYHGERAKAHARRVVDRLTKGET